jgi:O-antigen/teichoic acid export membrane protein
VTPAAGDGRRLVAGSLAQQGSQVTGLLAMLAIITVLARRLSLAELGVYGLLTSLVGYLLIVQNAAAGAAVRKLAASRDPGEAGRAFSSAAACYAGAGAITALLLVGAALALDPALGLGSELAGDVRRGGVLLAVVTALGWPLTIYRDALRADGLLVRVAVTEILSLVAYAALVLGLALGGASLAAVIGASGTIPLLAGVGCMLSASGRGYRFRPAAVTRRDARELLGLAGYLSLTEAAAAGIYAADRAILGVFSSATTVALFEGPVRAHNVVRALGSAITVSVLPSATRFHAEGDERRLRELLVRGIRYTLAMIVPPVVVGMVLAEPVLDVWLGERYRDGATAMTILMSHWLLNGCSGLLAAVLVGTGRARELARYALLVAVANLVLALCLAPSLGLEGVAIATAAPYALLFPLLLRRALEAVPAPRGELVRRAFAPPLAAGAVLAALLLAARALLSPDSVVAVGALASGAVALYWGAFYLVVMEPSERRLVRSLLRP